MFFFLFYPLVFCYHCSILTVAPCGFCHSFRGFLTPFLSRLWEGKDQGAGRMNQSGAHMQQLNAGNEGRNIGGAMGVFSGGSDRSIGQNFYFLDNMAPT